MPRYNIQSETDGESAPLTGNRNFNGADMGDQHITESDDDEDVHPYGFPTQQKRRNRRNVSDIDLLISNGGKIVFRFLTN